MYATATGTTFDVPLCQPTDTVVAIGDVHGCADQLASALAFAAELLRARRAARVVLLGDLIDRGPDSLRCLQLAAEFRDQFAGKVTLLAGNHEQFMLCALYHRDESVKNHAAFNWLRNGGRSLVLSSKQVQLDIERWTLGPTAWTSHAEIGNVIFVHAGVRCTAGLSELRQFLSEPIWALPTDSGESHAHWAWIRRGFLEYDIPVDDHFVVHGHTAREFTGKPLAGRINLDSGCHKTGQLTLGLFSPGQVELHTFGA